jgi:MFS transporter, DHA2 family, methylenomycin A resistance protein
MPQKSPALETTLADRAGVSRPNARPRSQQTLALFALCLGYFMVILDVTVVNIALPAMQMQLGATMSDLQWIVAGYSLAFASFLLSAGILGDKLGSKRIFLAGLGAFTCASALCGLAPTLLALQIFRLLQGLAAALLVPASLALISHTFAEPAPRARAIGTWGAIAGIAAASGPVLGGFLVSALSWRSIFLINVPVGALGFALTLAFVPHPPRSDQQSLDLPAQVLAVLSLSALTFALIEGPDLGWTQPVMLGLFALFLLATSGFILREKRASSPMLPLKLFNNATFSAGNGVGLLLNFGFYGQFFLINLFFARVQGYSSLLTGLALLPEAIMVLIASLLAGRVTARTGARIPMVLGLAIGGLGMLGMSLAQANGSYLLLFPTLLATGFGTAFTMPAMTSVVIENAPGERSSTASGVLNASRQVGQALGIACLGSLAAVSVNFHTGVRNALLIAGAAFLLGCLISALLISKRTT